MIKPRSLSEDDSRKELVANVVLSISIFFLGILEINLIYQYLLSRQLPADFVNPALFTLILLLFVGLLIISRIGYFEFASYVLVGLYLLATTYAAWRWGPDLYQVVVSYALIITLSGIVISSRFSFVTAIIIGLFIISANSLDLNNIINIDRSWKNEELLIDDTLVIGLTFLMIAFVSWLSNREIEKSLRRAHRSEKVLREQNESLEYIVEKKTRELRNTQAEKVRQLYRFAEFGRLSSGIFHDLINPLSAITVNIHAIKDDFHPKLTELKNYLARAVSASERMDRFIGVVKNQIRATDLNEKFCLNDITNEVLLLLNYQAKKSGVQLHFSTSEIVETFGNPLKFQQIVTNLVTNAIDAYQHSKISNPKKKVVIKLNLDNANIKFSVKDLGSGISPEILPRIFDTFFTTKSEGGVGLGLSSTKEAVEKDFGGSIEVASGKSGTTFIVSFPKRDSI